MNVEVALLFDDKANLNAHGATPHFLFDSERAHDNIHARASMITARRKAHLRKFHVIRGTRQFRLKTTPLNPRARAFNSAIEKIGKRLIDHAQHTSSINRETN